MIYIFMTILVTTIIKIISFSKLTNSNVYLHPRIRQKIEDENNFYK